MSRIIPGIEILKDQEKWLKSMIRREADLKATYHHLGAYTTDEIINNIEYLHGLVSTLNHVQHQIEATEKFYHSF